MGVVAHCSPKSAVEPDRALSCYILRPGEYRAVASNGQTSDSKQKSEITFEDSGIVAEVRTADGVYLSSHSFEASDGVGLDSFYGSFDSQGLATEQFERELAKAAKVLSRGEKKDKAGRIVGQRAEILMYSDKPDQTFPAILWTFGTNYREIMSASMRDNLALERELTD